MRRSNLSAASVHSLDHVGFAVPDLEKARHSYPHFGLEVKGPSSLDWAASTQSPEDGFYLWGPNVPEDFITNYEAPDAPPAR